MPRIELERIEQAEDQAQRSSESFDRIAFAEQAVALVRPAGTTVAICGGSHRLTLEAGRAWGRGPSARWAILCVPRDASRQAIANAVLELGVEKDRPWALDVLLAGANASPKEP